MQKIRELDPSMERSTKIVRELERTFAVTFLFRTVLINLIVID
jgi:hypothetical protein